MIGQALRSHPRSAWIVLGLSLVLTAFAWHISSNAIEKRLLDRWRFEAADISTAIDRRIRDQIQVLKAGVALFAASDGVERREFAEFVDTLDIDENYPGLQGYGFAEVVPKDGKDAHEARIRAEGFPDFALRPDGKRPIYTSITFLEPFDWRNKRAFGYDMFSEPVRRTAMELARDTGEAAMTAAVTLVQETGADVQQGFLIYLPVYRQALPSTTVDERRAALRGYVYSPFRMKDLMSGILGAAHANMRFRVYDAADGQAPQLLYRSTALEGLADGALRVTREQLAFAGHRWTLEVFAGPDAAIAGTISLPMMIGTGGLAIDVLIFLVISSISRQGEKARSIASTMTRELRRETRKTQQILDNVAEGIVVTDEAGQIVRTNPACQRLFGRSEQDLASTSIDALVPEALQTVSDPQVGLGMAGGVGQGLTGIECAGHRADKPTFPLSMSVTRMQDADGSFLTWVLRDISEQKRIEKVQTEFIGVVSHELRTPLTALSGSLSLLKQNASVLKASQREAMLSLAHRNAERLVLLVNDILDMEKFKTDAMVYNKKPVDLVPLIKELLEEHEPYAERVQAVLKVECDLPQAIVHADPDRLRQVLSNLISNAIKFNRPEGAVAVAVERRRRQFRIAVSDEGQGIDKPHRRRIFDSFYQIDKSDARGFAGTGLGLSIVATILKSHNSKIMLASRLGLGSVFFFNLETSRSNAEATRSLVPRRMTQAG